MKRWQELEQAVENLLIVNNFKYMRIKNYRCFKCGQVQNRKPKGWPDFFVYSPIVFAVECKTGKGKLSKEQAEMKKDFETVGIAYILLKDTVDDLLIYMDIKY